MLYHTSRQMKFILPLLAGFIVFFFTNCTDPITVGTETIGIDGENVGETMEIPFRTRVVPGDSLQVYFPETISPLPSFSLGQIEDEAFGRLRSGVYISPSLARATTTGLFRTPPFADRLNVNVDSIVLILPVDTNAAFYGPGRSFPIELLELNEMLDFNQDYFSSLELATNQTDLSQTGSFAATAEPQFLLDTVGTDGDTTSFSHVRVRFSDAFVQRINGFTASQYESDTVFRTNFGGVFLRPSADAEALVNVVTPTSGVVATGQNAGFFFYYPDTSDQDQTFYRAPFELWLPQIDYDYAGSITGALLSPGDDQELIAVAGEAGVMTEIIFDDLSLLENRVINRAAFEFPVATTDAVDYDTYPLPARIELLYRDGGGDLQPIEDRIELLRTGGSADAIEFFLNGLLEEDEQGNQFYSPTFSVHLQRILDGEVPPRLLLRVNPLRANQPRPARALLNGPDAITRPARLRVTFTELE